MRYPTSTVEYCLSQSFNTHIRYHMRKLNTPIYIYILHSFFKLYTYRMAKPYTN